MITETTDIETVAIHVVGNKAEETGYGLSKSTIELDDEIKEIMMDYFLSSFKSGELYNFYHDSELSYNEVCDYVAKIFDDSSQFFEQSVNLTKHLYEKSSHPNIKSGEFYVVLFHDCQIEGEKVDAVGLFKSENKDPFLKVKRDGDNFRIECDRGINPRKMDKGCLVFNYERENGFVVKVIDNTNHTEAHYWTDDFLHIRQRQDKYFNTHNVMSMYKNFVTKELPQQFEVSKADQADLLNRSVKFFKENENFEMQNFEDSVIRQPEVIEQFKSFKDTFSRENDFEIPDSFDISDSAVKKQSRAFKSVIKLDKNFHIYVHGNRNLIEQGEDEKGKFYKVYYKEEE